MTAPDLDEEVKALIAAGRGDAATELVLRRLGPELLGFLIGTARSETDALDAFSLLGEAVWRGLPGFEGRSSLRTWTYGLARNVLHRVFRDPRRRPERNVPLSSTSVHEALVVEIRDSTLAGLRNLPEDPVVMLRRQLDPDDQMLLVLRVDRAMGWRDVAQILHGEDVPADDALLDREAAALRKRFERVKQRLRELARDAGILPR